MFIKCKIPLACDRSTYCLCCTCWIVAVSILRAGLSWKCLSSKQVCRSDWEVMIKVSGCCPRCWSLFGTKLPWLSLLGWPTPDLVLFHTVPYKFISRICTLLQKKISIVNKVGNWHGPHGRIFGRASFVNLINETFLWLKNGELSVWCIAVAIWLEPSDVDVFLRPLTARILTTCRTRQRLLLVTCAFSTPKQNRTLPSSNLSCRKLVMTLNIPTCVFLPL